MKRFLLLLLLTSAYIVKAQNIVFENFNSGNLPTTWTVSTNTSISSYTQPFSCTTIDKGLQTPGVGKTSPSRIILPIVNYDAANGIIKVSFRVWVFNANLDCSSAKDFPCPTYVTAYLIKTVAGTGGNSGKYFYSNGTTEQKVNNLPAAGEIYASQSYKLQQANAGNTIIFNAPAIPDGASFRVYLDFKTAEGSDCTGQGTKFVFDDLSVIKNACNNCAPVAQDDYFSADGNGFLNKISGNLYGGNLKWTTQAPAGFQESSLTSSPAVGDGTDYDLNDPELAVMQYELVPGSLVISKSCNGPATLSEFTLNQNGTFVVDRGSNICISRVVFEYKLKNTLTNQVSVNSTKVTIDFPTNIALPVHFKSFSADRKNASTVALKWTTAFEQNNRGFYVQRNVGGEWKNVAFVFSQADAGGNSSSDLSYEYFDQNAEKGISQYRIQQVDLDYKATYSDIRAVKGEGAVNKVTVYPNPSADGKVNVVFEKTTSVKDVQVSDLQGRTVKMYVSVKGNVLVIDELKTGFYTLKITDRSTAVSSVEKVVVK